MLTEKIQQHLFNPSSPFYYPVQLFVELEIFHLTHSLLSSFPSRHAILFVSLAYAIDRLCCPLFAKLLEPYGHMTLVPLLGNMSHIFVSVVLSKTFCQIVGITLKINQIYLIGLCYLITLFATQLLYKKIQTCLSETTSL